jgi:hypothetical protein
MWKQKQKLYSTSARTAWDREFYYSEVYPPNLTVEWVDTDIPENAQYEKNILYSFNEYGFRSDSFDDRSEINILTCGCSMTVGVGVDQHENWTNQLKQKIIEHTGKTVTAWNIATAGASPDYVARSIWKLHALLNPDFVFIYWPAMTRLELPILDKSGKITQSFMGDDNFPKHFIDEDYLFYLLNKNTIFLQEYFATKDTCYVDNPIVETAGQHVMLDYNLLGIDNKARDGIHPGPDWHKRVAEYYFQKSINISL